MKSILVSAFLFLATSVAIPAQRPEVSRPIVISRSGSQSSRPGPAENFTGSVHVDPLFQPTSSRMTGAYVTFQPSARAAWHSHPFGQTLIVTAGVGRVQRWGDPVDEIRPGDVVWIPPGQKHWHGAGPDSTMTHIALVQLTEDGKSTDWMEKVTDSQYAAPVRASAPVVRPTAGKQNNRDIAPTR